MPLSTAEQTIARIGLRPLTYVAITPSFSLNSSVESPETDDANTNFDKIISQQFERCRQENILRTDPLAPDVLRRQLIPGKLGLLAEHEPSLFARKRPTQNSEHVAIDAPFNPDKFNFNRAGEEEILIQIVDGTEDTPPHRILVNVSPLMYGHGLLVPWCEQGLPQHLTHQPIELAIKLLRRCATSNFCIGFNSLGAFSSVNHLHLHILYPSELDHEARGKPLMEGRMHFPIAYAPVHSHITNCYGGIDCKVDELDWMVPCFSFQSNNDDNCLHKAVSSFVRYLHNKKIPHNVLFIQEEQDKKFNIPIIRCIVIPRQHQDKFDKNKHGFNAALGEISGMLIARTKEHFDRFEEKEVVRLLRCFVACKEDTQRQISSELNKETKYSL